MQRLLGDRKEDTEKVTRQLEDLNTLKRPKYNKKEKEWETTETANLGIVLLYHMENRT